jgi:Glucosamine 6-phosphate synthetase, contains amidotransferase and phosphosugar isomerase domains
MCGIIGYAGAGEASEFIIKGLKELEYRGYDSSGIAVLNGRNIEVVKKEGRISRLEEELKKNPKKGKPRDRPHALGDARKAFGFKRPSLPLRKFEICRRPQRHNRKLS